MEVDAAFGLIARAIDAGRPAHGYLLAGDLKGPCEDLVRRVLLKLFPDATAQVEAGSHPDIARLEPEGAKRIIKVDAMRERIVEPMQLASFSGGWKAGVIVGADRMEAASANAFLKSLEEPTPQTVYFLLTDQPDAILPTIVSRTQRIDLPLAGGLLEGDALERAGAALAAKDLAALVELLDELKESDDAATAKKAFFRTLLGFVRPFLAGDRLPRYQAFRNIEAVEEAYHQSTDCSMGDEAVLAFLLDRLVFPFWCVR